VVVEVVVHQAVVLPPILVQRSARRCLVLGRSALLNIVSVRRVSNPLRKVNKRRQITVILVQMLQLKFAVRETARTRSNVLRILPDGVMQHMQFSNVSKPKPSTAAPISRSLKPAPNVVA
jgi:hypothetical protein